MSQHVQDSWITCIQRSFYCRSENIECLGPYSPESKPTLLSISPAHFPGYIESILVIMLNTFVMQYFCPKFDGDALKNIVKHFDRDKFKVSSDARTFLERFLEQATLAALKQYESMFEFTIFDNANEIENWATIGTFRISSDDTFLNVLKAIGKEEHNIFYKSVYVEKREEADELVSTALIDSPANQNQSETLNSEQGKPTILKNPKSTEVKPVTSFMPTSAEKLTLSTTESDPTISPNTNQEKKKMEEKGATTENGGHDEVDQYAVVACLQACLNLMNHARDRWESIDSYTDTDSRQIKEKHLTCEHRRITEFNAAYYFDMLASLPSPTPSMIISKTCMKWICGKVKIERSKHMKAKRIEGIIKAISETNVDNLFKRQITKYYDNIYPRGKVSEKLQSINNKTVIEPVYSNENTIHKFNTSSLHIVPKNHDQNKTELYFKHKSFSVDVDVALVYKGEVIQLNKPDFYKLVKFVHNDTKIKKPSDVYITIKEQEDTGHAIKTNYLFTAFDLFSRGAALSQNNTSTFHVYYIMNNVLTGDAVEYKENEYGFIESAEIPDISEFDIASGYRIAPNAKQFEVKPDTWINIKQHIRIKGIKYCNEKRIVQADIPVFIKYYGDESKLNIGDVTIYTDNFIDASDLKTRDEDIKRIVMSTSIENTVVFKDTVILGFGGSGTGKTTLLLSHEHSFVQTFLNLCPVAIGSTGRTVKYSLREYYWIKEASQSSVKFKMVDHMTEENTYTDNKSLQTFITDVDTKRNGAGRICETQNNDKSSRSVLVYTFSIMFGEKYKSTLKLIDLPGYENSAELDVNNSSCIPKASDTRGPIIEVIKDSIKWCKSKGTTYDNKSYWGMILHNDQIKSDNVRIISLFLFNNLSKNSVKRSLYHFAYHKPCSKENSNYFDEDTGVKNDPAGDKGMEYHAKQGILKHIAKMAYDMYKNMQGDQTSVARLLDGKTLAT